MGQSLRLARKSASVGISRSGSRESVSSGDGAYIDRFFEISLTTSAWSTKIERMSSARTLSGPAAAFFSFWGPVPIRYGQCKHIG